MNEIGNIDHNVYVNCFIMLLESSDARLTGTTCLVAGLLVLILDGIGPQPDGLFAWIRAAAAALYCQMMIVERR